MALIVILGTGFLPRFLHVEMQLNSDCRITLTRQTEEMKCYTSELMTTKEFLKKTREELQTFAHELTVVIEIRDSIQMELVDVYRKAKTISID
ncbi:hypothetical protein CCACVL1_22374 [Corchorus capsularis]|uniref:Uncharacterized protein n=1 Tax=Corchorus capsularis TaxID=210143 RepID=A0A1R3GZT8_COCAP|nr:hypothetical protein CCACVL1_22374 [Corchorus capsularis]